MSTPRLKHDHLMLLALVLSLSAGGCYEDSLTIRLYDGDEIPWGAFLPVQINVVEQGEDPADGSEVQLITTVGSFQQYDPDEVTSPVRTRTLALHAGEGVCSLFSFPGEGGRSGVLTATYKTIGSIKLSDRVEIHAAEGGAPTGRGLSAHCDPKNIAVLSDEAAAADMRIRCVVMAQDALGEPVPNLQFNPLLEQGGCVMSPVTGGEAGTYEFSLTPSCEPLDVLPLGSEPHHVYADRIHNPRDGLMTIVFHTTGMEGFNDSNSNGVWDQGELFDDLAEPFVDADDDGTCGSNEAYVDVNHDGQWSPANGRWDESTEIWVAVHILFSGPPHESADTTRFEPTGLDIPNGGSQTLSLFLVDVNHNPIAANHEDDGITFEGDPAIVNGEGFIPLQDTLGLDFTASGLIDITSFDRYRNYQVIVRDPDPNTNQSAPASLRTRIRFTPAPAFQDSSPAAREIDLTTVHGTVR